MCGRIILDKIIKNYFGGLKILINFVVSELRRVIMFDNPYEDFMRKCVK